MKSKGARTEPRELVKLKYSVHPRGKIKRSATKIIAGAEKTHLRLRLTHRENLSDFFESLRVTVATADSFRSKREVQKLGPHGRDPSFCALTSYFSSSRKAWNFC